MVTTSWEYNCHVISPYIHKSRVPGIFIVEHEGNNESIAQDNQVTSNEILHGMSKIYEHRETGRHFNFLEPEKLLKCKMVAGVIERPDSDHHRSSSELFGNTSFYPDNLRSFVEFNVAVDCDRT